MLQFGSVSAAAQTAGPAASNRLMHRKMRADRLMNSISFFSSKKNQYKGNNQHGSREIARLVEKRHGVFPMLCLIKLESGPQKQQKPNQEHQRHRRHPFNIRIAHQKKQRAQQNRRRQAE